ncbi:hypothetical protein [Candidatus Pantoea bituminis]|uniref:hypothetical protein n=1 Tax=Candidatus Pantoea bituminis TaxID=2831036 RepID=UPI001C05F4EA|nr:hypothetical protein [Pantoea bituminis]
MSTNALLTGVIGEAVLELIERKELVASDSILKMIEKNGVSRKTALNNRFLITPSSG